MRLAILSEDEARTLTLKFFGAVSFPFTRNEFKSHFRSACKRLHTDTSGGDTKDKFIAMKDFYDRLCDQNPSWAFSDGGVKEPKTFDGDLLSELGLGLGPTKNGRDCDTCHHKGFVEEQNRVRRDRGQRRLPSIALCARLGGAVSVWSRDPLCHSGIAIRPVHQDQARVQSVPYSRSPKSPRPGTMYLLASRPRSTTGVWMDTSG